MQIICASTYRLHKPSITSEFKPSQMTTPGSSHHDTIRRALDLVEWESFATSNLLNVSASLVDKEDGQTYWIILGLDGQERNSYGKQGISRSSVTVVCAFCRVTPCRTLYGPIDKECK